MIKSSSECSRASSNFLRHICTSKAPAEPIIASDSISHSASAHCIQSCWALMISETKSIFHILCIASAALTARSRLFCILARATSSFFISHFARSYVLSEGARQTSACAWCQGNNNNNNNNDSQTTANTCCPVASRPNLDQADAFASEQKASLNGAAIALTV